QQYQNGDRDLKEAVTNVSHDLRTPLTAICGYLDLLEGEEKSEAAERYLSLIRGRTDHLRSLTEEFFRTSAVLAAEEPEPAEPVSLNRAVEESLAAWYGVLSARGIAPEVELPETPVVRPLNREAVSRILSNVLSNAAKYSPGDLRIVLEEDGTLTFSNAAPSLTPVLAERLFDRYFTVESGGQGTGLGLSIARRLTEQMGGTAAAGWQEGILTVRLYFPEK
ncbi:MAG: HAMP domain-containing histidine kinase, partial [Oscillospiraceae bacterium]|nr:HAMP domain-containing histidine kinase [Oscillospiraceae bacterium]